MGVSSTRMVPLSASTKRGSMLTSVVLPLPDRPTKATVWPGSTVKEMSLTVSRSASGKRCLTLRNSTLPRTGSASSLVPVSISGVWSINVKTLSADTSIFCMRAATLVRRLMGSKICASAAMNEAKLPTVRDPLLAWLSATAMTAPTEIEMQTWVSGVRAASAVAVRMANRRRRRLTKSKRPRSTS
ncbi:hypothetical protein D3C73_1134350 [compost metagenome]